MSHKNIRSHGHICFIGHFEYLWKEGEVFRAPRIDPLAEIVWGEDGRTILAHRRHGRWECSAAQWPTFRRLAEEAHEIP